MFSRGLPWVGSRAEKDTVIHRLEYGNSDKKKQ